MLKDYEAETTPRTHSTALMVVLGVALVAALGSLIWSFTLSGRVNRQEAELTDVRADNAKLSSELRETEARLKVAQQELGDSLGLTQKQMEASAQEILRKEQADSRRLETAQKQTAQQVTAVQGDVSAVKTDVGGVKTDLTKTQGDLATAVGQLQSMKGDLDSHSTLIARNHDELEILKHKGDKNYYEFTLVKGHRKPVGTISLELRKVDAKRNRFTLNVYSDDKTYEKKDRNLNEPLQFYSGKDPMLYEIVVNSVSAKNTVTGYLATPKNAPAPPSVQ